MKKTTLSLMSLVAVAAALVGNMVVAGEKKSELTAIELTGTVSVETKTKEKDGKSHTYTVYHLTVDGQRIHLPQAHKKCGEPKDTPLAYDLSSFVDKTVNVVAKGHVKEGKDGKKYTHIHSIASISEASSDSASEA